MFPNLRAEMARRNFSTHQLADLLGVSKRTAENKLSGKTEFTLSEIQAVTGFFNATVDYLFSAEGVGV